MQETLLEPKFGPVGKEVFDRTYSREKEDGTKETWADTVARVIKGNTALVDEKFIEQDEREKLFDLIYNFKIIPAGRHLWASGVPGRQFLFNCWRAPFVSKMSEHYAFTFDQLMQGGGVGANYSNRYIDQIGVVTTPVNVKFVCKDTHPDIEEMEYLLDEVYDHTYTQRHLFVDDSREGWVNALVEIIDRHFWGHEVNTEMKQWADLIIDVSKIRERGKPIRGFGGVASGPAALVRMLIEVNELMNKLVGQQLATLDHMHIDHALAKCVIAGNVRRSARMSLKSWLDSDIFEFINCKGSDKSDHWTTNISVEIDNEFISLINSSNPIGDHAKNVYHAVIEGMLRDGEPGFYNLSLAQEGENGDVGSTNPCVTGDTLVAVADGRGAVPINVLADSNEDIPMYSFNIKTNKIEVQKGLNPRVTGFQQDIIKVTLNNGTSFKVTKNHKFLMLDGTYKEAQFLEKGEALRPFSRWSGKYTDTRNKYWFVEAGHNTKRGEHVLIGEFLGNDGSKVVHHIDFNGLNNDLNNLRLMTPQEHTDYHGSISIGKNNPMFGKENKWGSHTDEAKKKIGEANKGKTLTEAHKIALSNYRKSLSIPPINKICEECNNVFVAPYRRREQAFCSHSCSNIYQHKNGKSIMALDTRAKSRQEKQLKQAIIFNDLSVELSRIPLKKEWETKCSDLGVPRRLGKGPDSHIPTFKNYRELTEFALTINHRVLSIEYVGKEDVYNVTVEKNHNLALVAEVESKKTKGKINLSGIFVAQCGEIALEPFEACILGHVNLAAFSNTSPDDYADAFRLMTRFLMRATFGDIPNKQARAIVDKNRRIGVGFFGFQSWLVQRGIKYSESHRIEEVRNWLKYFKAIVDDEKETYAFQLRIPVPIKGTCIAPTGSIAKLPGESEAIQTIYSPYVIRKIRYADNDSRIQEFIDNGYEVEDCIYNPNTKVVSFYYKDPLVEKTVDESLVEGAHDVALEDFLAVQAMVQECYADNAISFTINVEPDKYSVEEAMDIFKTWLPKLKGTTVMPDSSRPQSPYTRISKVDYEFAEYAKSYGSGELACSITGCPEK